MKRFLKRLAYGVFALLVLAAIIIPISYSQWRPAYIEKLAAASTLAETAKGAVEYVTVGNQENPSDHLMILHGSPGGYDAGLLVADWLDLDKNIQSVVPSRPGYLRTPLETGVTAEAAADAMVALMDTLGIEKMTVLAWSGGGPTALVMAERYPERVKGLILLSARIRSDYKYYFGSEEDRNAPYDPSDYAISDGFWGPDLKQYAQLIGLTLMPDVLVEGFFPDDVASKDVTVDRLRQASKTIEPISIRNDGRQADIWAFASLEREPALNITAPTLIIHSPIDASGGYEHATYAHETIKGSELFVVENESHFSTLTPAAVTKVKAFLASLK